MASQTKPKAEGRVQRVGISEIPGRRGDQFGLRFSGVISIPRDGKYTFYTRSDDGSRLYIDGKAVVENEGVRAAQERAGTIDLRAGDYPITVTYFEAAGEEELSASWEGPGITKQEIPPEVLFSVGGRPMIPLESGPFTIDPLKAPAGRQMFTLLGCASCHNTVPDTPSQRPAKALAAVDVASAEGCLSPTPRKGIPQYHLSTGQREAIVAALKGQAALSQPLTGPESVVRTMAAMNCFACHARDEVGGPGPGRKAYFQMTGEFDMGDEGRIPPRLGDVGAKLKPEAMEQVIFEAKLHVRPVLATRMPRFSREAMKGFVPAVQEADGGAVAQKEPPFSEQAARDGRLLVGTNGLGCVNCHGAAGAKSLGMPAPDLATVHARIKPKWFGELLHNPAGKNPETRMPAFWADGSVTFKDVAGGTEQGQIDAIYSYLSLGETMPLPAGLQPDQRGYELIVGDRPLVHRTFMAGVGTRAALVGYPENVHVAFDANAVRLARLWRGRFFDARGMWDGRGGAALQPLGIDVIDLPPGPAFAVLPDAKSPWPRPKDSRERDSGGHFAGYRLDREGRPVFMYDIDDARVEEQPLPVLRPGGSSLIRRFTVRTTRDIPGLYFLAASGGQIDQKSAGEWVVDDRLTIRSDQQLVVNESDGKRHLLLPVSFKNGMATFDVEMSW